MISFLSSIPFIGLSKIGKGCKKPFIAMHILTQCLNPVTGEKEWNLQKEDYDYKQEIARSSYADMLHDTERNDLYFEAIRRSVALLKSEGKEVHVLDIGTGTGLLSMMALSCGVHSVTACEAFRPMAECARNILKTNEAYNKINLIVKRSTEIQCGEGRDMPRRANLLVTEVFDTELIGEGAIETYSHAVEHLLTPDALFVPSVGTVYAQVVSSELIRGFNVLNPVTVEDGDDSQVLLAIPESVKECPGAAAVQDVQLSEFSSKSFTALSDPLPVFEFDWSGRNIPLDKRRVKKKTFKSLTSGTCDALFMWWDLKMDSLGEVILSCAPLWAHPRTKGNPKAKSSDLPWRDHWMQAIYYFPKSFYLEKSKAATLTSSHDEYSLWFDISKYSSEIPSERPVCECGIHAITSRARMGQLNDPYRRSLYERVIHKYIKEDTVCLFIGDSAYMAVVFAKLGARHVYIQVKEGIARRTMDDFIRTNDVADKITVLSSPLETTKPEELVSSINLVFGEPYFETSYLPWHSLQFLYQLKSAKHLLSEDAVILPQRVTVWGLPVQFRDLCKIRQPLITCSGFNMGPFDELIDGACDETDDPIEPQPLYEYPTTALGVPSSLFTIPFTLEDLQQERECKTYDMPLHHSGILNGIALWCDWHFGEECFSTGPIEKVILGEQISSWDMYTRQGVHILKKHQELSIGHSVQLSCCTTFKSEEGELNFDFTLD